MTGRKCTITDEKMGALKAAFSCGMNVLQACSHSGVSVDAYNRYCQKHPAFRDEIRELRARPESVAIINIVSSLKSGDLDTAKWLLQEKRKKAESRERIRNWRAARKAMDISNSPEHGANPDGDGYLSTLIKAMQPSGNSADDVAKTEQGKEQNADASGSSE